jgi:transcriptional regulator CtsR
MNDDLGSMDTVVACFKYCLGIRLERERGGGGIMKVTKTEISTVGVPVEIQTGHSKK